jgi:hypothetical protein
MTGHIMIRGATIPLEETASKNELDVMDEYPSDFDITESLKFALVMSVKDQDLSTYLSDALLIGEGLPVDDGDLSNILIEGIVITNT